MGSRRSAFVASGIILTIVAAIIVTYWVRYRLPAPIVAIIPETTAHELWESEHAGVAATIAGTPWRTYWNGPSSEDQVVQQIALVQQSESVFGQRKSVIRDVRTQTTAFQFATSASTANWKRVTWRYRARWMPETPKTTVSYWPLIGPRETRS
jgi:hypothetical protein